MTEGERKHINLKNGLHYSGTIISEDDKSITICDKFGGTVIIFKDSIMVIEPERKP